ncbi:olfactory receptor 1496-like [Pyxicephalus adspersus]|uniref:olfactory receptor 1496-like n=1 Tax=Pyxicephalus adspersus TaxID=30357 RepID=UPI003B590301
MSGSVCPSSHSTPGMCYTLHARRSAGNLNITVHVQRDAGDAAWPNSSPSTRKGGAVSRTAISPSLTAIPKDAMGLLDRWNGEGFIPPTLLTEKLWQASFCGFNLIDHFFCDLDPIVQLICSDTSEIQMEAMFFGVPVIICPFVVIMISYVYIIVIIVRIPSVSGRQKAVSTCSSHLSVVVIFYGTLLAMYEFPSSESSTTRKILSMLYTVLVPLLNALIYSLRNKDIKIAYTQIISMSNISTIFLMGFHNMGKYNLLVFSLILLVYYVTICGNLLIITLVSYSKSLHSPMYFFLSHLSVTDIMLITDIAPNMLNIVLHDQTPITLPGCITQLYFFTLSETIECLLLLVMSYDRYLAICSPLHYVSIMSPALCIEFVFAVWLLSCSLTSFIILGVCSLDFCGPNLIDHFFCDFYPLVELSCSDTSIVQMESTMLCVAVIVLPFLLIVLSYTYIVSTILKIPSLSGRMKSFSTCSSHLTVVSIFYGTLIAMYVLPNGKGQSQVISKVLALLYTVFTPFLNPFIYTLRNKDIKNAFRHLLQTNKV